MLRKQAEEAQQYYKKLRRDQRIARQQLLDAEKARQEAEARLQALAQRPPPSPVVIYTGGGGGGHKRRCVIS